MGPACPFRSKYINENSIKKCGHVQRCCFVYLIQSGFVYLTLQGFLERFLVFRAFFREIPSERHVLLHKTYL